jgi:nucleoside-diphosphate-sugar epimerase
MKILLTGSAGFTGLFFRKMALAAGHEVVDLQSDLLQAEQLMSEVLAVQPQAVLHLAGISFVGHENDTDFYSVNVIGSVNLLKALAALPTSMAMHAIRPSTKCKPLRPSITMPPARLPWNTWRPTFKTNSPSSLLGLSITPALASRLIF